MWSLTEKKPSKLSLLYQNNLGKHLNSIFKIVIAYAPLLQVNFLQCPWFDLHDPDSCDPVITTKHEYVDLEKDKRSSLCTFKATGTKTNNL